MIKICPVMSTDDVKERPCVTVRCARWRVYRGEGFCAMTTPQIALDSQISLDELKSRLCVRCQACCKLLMFEVDKLVETFRFYAARQLQMVTKDNKMYVVVPHVCPHLTPKGCAIYKTRPQACQCFDGRDCPAVMEECLWKHLPF
jgi:hypothetical protein